MSAPQRVVMRHDSIRPEVHHREGYDSLGYYALACAPIAFLSYQDRAWLMGSDTYCHRDQLPPAFSLRAVGAALAREHENAAANAAAFLGEQWDGGK